MAGDKRKVQEINAGSMADIAFLLLIFFLVATTMNTDTGLTRVLPPMPDPNQKQEDVKVKERNLLLVFVSKGNNYHGGRPANGHPPAERQGQGVYPQPDGRRKTSPKKR